MDNYGGVPGGLNQGQPGVRPKVDPEALGEVDPEMYGQPKEATHKIRGKSDILELLCGDVDQELLTVKTFYFFFYSAFGSLFPLMGVYFKQMGMNPGQCGLLIGSRPFVEFLAAPFWGSLADRWQKGKMLLLASLSCWIIFTLPLGFIQPPATSCLVKKNHTEYVLETPKVPQILKREAPWAGPEPQLPTPLAVESGIHNTLKRDTPPWIESDILTVEEEEPLVRKIRAAKPRVLAGQSPLDIKFVQNYDEKEQSNWVSPIFSSIVYRTQFTGTLTTDEPPEDEVKDSTPSEPILLTVSSIGRNITEIHNAERLGDTNDSEAPLNSFISIVFPPRQIITKDIQKAFFLLLLLVVIGEFFSAPAITLADSAVITLLGDDADRYGHQRMFGSLGWGLSMFFVGIALDHSTAFPDHPCGPDEREKNYTICFATFSVLMGAALICASQINFKYEFSTGQPDTEKPPPEPTREDYLQQELAQQLNLPALATNSINGPPPPVTSKTQMFAQTTREIPEWVTVLKYFANVKCGSFLFVSWFMGFGIGLIFTFLFWHLQDYGGSPTLFGVASVINHISEIFAYFFSFKLITQMGHVKVLCLGLAGNVVRFLYISYLKNPWWVLPFEFMQGITHAAVWAACCSYIAHNTPQHLRSSAQGVLQGIHHGLGRGCGAVIGGLFVTYFGTTATFRAYGLMCGVVLAGFIFINFYRIDTGFISELPVTEDPHQVAEETAHLAPHGVPSNPIPRALSSNRLHDMASDQGYGATYNTTGGNLDIPGAGGNTGGGSTNPFRQYSDINDHQSNKPTISEEETIRRHFQMYSEVLSQYDGLQSKAPPLTNVHSQQPEVPSQRSYEW